MTVSHFSRILIKKQYSESKTHYKARLWLTLGGGSSYNYFLSDRIKNMKINGSVITSVVFKSFAYYSEVLYNKSSDEFHDEINIKFQHDLDNIAGKNILYEIKRHDGTYIEEKAIIRVI